MENQNQDELLNLKYRYSPSCRDEKIDMRAATEIIFSIIVLSIKCQNMVRNTVL